MAPLLPLLLLLLLLTPPCLPGTLPIRTKTLSLHNSFPITHHTNNTHTQRIHAHCFSSYGLNWSSGTPLIFWLHVLPLRQSALSAAVLCVVTWPEQRRERLFWAWDFGAWLYAYVYDSNMHWNISAQGFHANGVLAFGWTIKESDPLPRVEIWNDIKGEGEDQPVKLKCKRARVDQAITFDGSEYMPGYGWQYTVKEAGDILSCEADWINSFRYFDIWNLKPENKVSTLPRDCLWRITAGGIYLNGQQ